MKSRRGFTLIELLVVISIIALLTSIVLSSLSSARERAKNSAIRSSAAQWRTALTAYALDTGRFYSTNFQNICLGLGTCFIQASGSTGPTNPDATFNSVMDLYLKGTPNPNTDFVNGTGGARVKAYYFGDTSQAIMYWYLFGDVACGLGGTKLFVMSSGNTACSLNL
jgi:prepilin-type N-terminal cleavage/methylation domain-containing protein